MRKFECTIEVPDLVSREAYEAARDHGYDLRLYNQNATTQFRFQTDALPEVGDELYLRLQGREQSLRITKRSFFAEEPDMVAAPGTRQSPQVVRLQGVAI